MVSPPDSIAILQLMVKLASCKIAVEVGAFTGMPSPSVAYMALLIVLLALPIVLLEKLFSTAQATVGLSTLFAWPYGQL